jgi:hypothetical protein
VERPGALRPSRRQPPRPAARHQAAKIVLRVPRRVDRTGAETNGSSIRLLACSEAARVFQSSYRKGLGIPALTRRPFRRSLCQD